MPVSADSFGVFRAELGALRSIISGMPSKTVGDEALRERFRMLFRTWSSVVAREVEPFLASRKEFLKLSRELEMLAQLASKRRRTAEYRMRLGRASSLADQLILYVPVVERERSHPRLDTGSDLFVPGIPDLPTRFVPSGLFGWRSQIARFVDKHRFDKSVFIMIRYRERNADLIRELKRTLSEHGYDGILASEHRLTDDLYNPVACLLCCSAGVAVFDEAEAAQIINPNVAYELGMLHLLGRGALILKHRSLKALNTDILMKLYQEYQTTTEIRAHVAAWLAQDSLPPS